MKYEKEFYFGKDEITLREYVIYHQEPHKKYYPTPGGLGYYTSHKKIEFRIPNDVVVVLEPHNASDGKVWLWELNWTIKGESYCICSHYSDDSSIMGKTVKEVIDAINYWIEPSLITPDSIGQLGQKELF